MRHFQMTIERAENGFAATGRAIHPDHPDTAESLHVGKTREEIHRQALAAFARWLVAALADLDPRDGPPDAA